MRNIILLIAAAVISGCAAQGSAEDANIGHAPSSWREMARSHMRSQLFDPYSARDISISAPTYANPVWDGATMVPHSGWFVCVRANAKNRMGAYTGQQLTGMLFENGKITVTLAEPTHGVATYCGNKFEPFTL